VIAFALELGMPPTDLKLISAVIVTLALSASTIKERLVSFQKRLSARQAGREYRSDVKN
jgi:putative ABC transport system permease protein